MKEKLLISACLMGENCKYSGGSNYCPAVEQLRKRFDLIPVCPERDGGLPTPRIPSERQGDRVVNREGEDVTAQFRRGAELALRTALENNCSCALFKNAVPPAAAAPSMTAPSPEPSRKVTVSPRNF